MEHNNETVTHHNQRYDRINRAERRRGCCWKLFSNFLGVGVDVEPDSKFEMVYLQRGENDKLTEVDIKRLKEQYIYSKYQRDEEDSD